MLKSLRLKLAVVLAGLACLAGCGEPAPLTLAGDPDADISLSTPNSAAATAAAPTPLEIAKPGDGPFRAYITASKDFQPVRQDRELLLNRWDHWVLMPWRASWGVDYDEALAAKLAEAGFNGGFCNRAPGDDGDLHQKHGFLWYMDHTAGKGDLHLGDKNGAKDLRAQPNRPVCLADPATIERLQKRIEGGVKKAKPYTTRAAYALDDEVSWTSFTSPAKWDNNPLTIAQFQAWLTARYGSKEACLKAWGAESDKFWDRMANPDDFQDLYAQPLANWNLSPWCDAISFMDSQFNNLVGDLVTYANKIDPETPCGYVGGQCPAPYGGFDYAKLMRKIQFLEAYDIGGNMEITRSLSPGNLMPTVKTGFEADPASDKGRWMFWYYLAHGDRGNIYWAEDWFTNGKPDKNHPEPKPDAEGEAGKPIPNKNLEMILKVGPVVKQLAAVSQRTTIGAKFQHDGVALYYSHPSIQVSWFMDCEKHGLTWINRGSSMNNALASTVADAWAWQKLLEDLRLQYNWVSYAQVLEKGIDPNEYKLLILPRTLCLSAEEAKVLNDYVKNGGHLIADHMTGLFDEHGKAWPQPVLDELFGSPKNPGITGGAGLFGGQMLSEIDAEKYYDTNFVSACVDTWPACKRSQGLVVANRNADTLVTRQAGKGTATFLNLSILEYCRVRSDDFAQCAAYIKPVSDLITAAGVKPRVTLTVGGKTPDIAEAIYWEKDGRVSIFVVKNPLKFASAFGATKTEGVKDEVVDLTITLNAPATKARNEMTSTDLPDGKAFTVKWNLCEAAVISYQK